MSAYLDLLEISYNVDVANSKAKSKRDNLKARIFCRAFSLSDKKFIKRYRLSKKLTKSLIKELTAHIPAARRTDSLDVDLKVLIALAFYATGSYQTSLGDNRSHCVSQASVSKAIKEVTRALNNPSIINKYVSFPFQQQERENIKRQFYQKFQLPGALGCIDGTHVAIVRPRKHEERYYNRKGYHSLNILIVCDASLNIMCVDTSFPGSTHESVVWSNHRLNSYLNRLHSVNGEDLYLLGDSGYPLRPTMMVPLEDVEPGSSEEYYQGLQLTARSAVERCISVLKARFRCLLVDRKLHYSPVASAKIANACCVLHNIAHNAQMPYTPLTPEEAARERQMTEGASGYTAENQSHLALTQLQLGQSRRQALINGLWSNRDSM